MRSILLVLPAMLASAPAFAQSVDTKGWAVTSATIPIEKDLRLELEGQARFGDAADGMYEFILAGFVSYRISEKATISFGYQRNESSRREPRLLENRLRQQVSGELAKIAGGTLTGRLRFEQRFRTDQDEVQLRWRPQIAYSRAFKQGGKTRWTISHESFIGTEVPWNNQIGYFRMRNQAGIRIPLSKLVSVETSYMNQYEFGRRGRRDTMDHVGIVNLIWSL